MKINRLAVIASLPRVSGRREVIATEQDVPEIMNEVIKAHYKFAPDYMRIAKFFAGGTEDEVARKLFDFCKDNIKYNVEGTEMQTTRSPGALMAMGSGDCKHYAGFIGGVLGALGFTDWCYRFAGYKLLTGVPGHVFIVLHPGKTGEVWVDPVLPTYNDRSQIPYIKRDRKVNANAMLERLSGIGDLADKKMPSGFYAVTRVRGVVPGKIGGQGAIGSNVQGGVIVNGANNQPLAGVGVWLMGSDRLTVTDSGGNWSLDVGGFEGGEVYAYKPGFNIMRAATKAVINGYRWFVQPVWDTINQARKNEFASGLYYSRLIFGMDIIDPPFTLTVDGEPYDLPAPAWFTRAQGGAQVQLLPQGIEVQYPATYQGQAIPADMLRVRVNVDRTVDIVNAQGGLYEFPGYTGSQTIAKLVGNNNFLLKVLACVCGSIQLSCDPFPDCYNVQREYDNILNFRNINVASARQTKTVAGAVVEGLTHAIAEIGKGFVKFIGIIPRNAFLQLVRLNVKGMATHLYQNLQDPGTADQIRKKWEGFGGDYGHLLNAARDGSDKKALGQIGVAGADDAAVAAAIAAAAPLIALLAQWLKSQNNPALNTLVDGAIGKMNDLLVAAGEDPIAVSTAAGGKPVIVDTGSGTLTIPPHSFGGSVMSFISSHPVETALIAGGSVILISQATSKRRK